MNRFFVDKAQIEAGKIRINDPDDVCHLVRALRIEQGEQLSITDGQGCAYVAVVDQILKTEIILKVEKTFKERKRHEQKILLTLACAIPKFTKFEEIVDKGTQLGVDEIIPLLTERTLVEKDVFKKRKERLNRVMMSAAKQSGALFLPQIKEAVFFNEFINTVPHYALSLIPNLSRTSLALKEAVSGFKSGRILVLIGPEGDFTQREIDSALSRGCHGVSLGESVLRVDTAAIAVLSFLRLFFEL